MMKKKKYNFEIVFKKLEEAREEQKLIDNSDFLINKEIQEHIRELKEFYDESQKELETYTRS
jgi:hypothetical protein